jgi:hypothetical protein
VTTLFSSHAFRRLNLPGALLMTLLQRSPAVQAVATAVEFVAASPVGQVLRSVALAAASLGAIHSMAGATQFVASKNPVTGTVGTPITPATFAVTGAQTMTMSYRILSGSLPPGLTLAGLDTGTNIVNTSIGTITGTPTMAGSFSIGLRAYEFTNAKGDAWPTSGVLTLSFTFAAGTSVVAPAFTMQPTGQTVNAGATVTFTAAVSGTPAPALQWTHNDVAITGATSATLTLTNVQPTDAGSYAVIATNSAGSVSSNAATLVVNAAVAVPVFTVQPAAQTTMAVGSTAVLKVSAPDATSFQWRFNDNPIAGATDAMLVLTQLTAAQAGAYSCVATNSAGSTTSTTATLNVTATSDPGRLINLSILTPLAVAESMTMGTVLGGAGTTGAKALLARAAGPSLAPFGVTDVLPDPNMTLNSTSVSPAVVVATNDNWAGSSTLSAAFASVGAFSYFNSTTTDAAIFRQDLQPGNYTVQVSDTSGASGTAIAEIYDATPAGEFTSTTPRLINVSVLKEISTGATLTAGFVIGGSTARTVLIRAIGPGLTPLGVGGVMADPTMTLVNISASPAVTVATDDDWGGTAAIAQTANRVGAFAINDPASKDAMLLVTLAPGNYTAQVAPIGTGGTAIVEIYELP